MKNRETQSMQKSNIWQEAIKEKQRLAQSSPYLEKTFIIVGPSSSGKSSFIKIFKGDSDFEVKPTNLLEYTHIKKQSISIKKQIINCYEIASESLMEVILSLVNKENFEQVVFVLCVDLGRIGGSIDEVFEWVRIIRQEGQKIVNEKLINKKDKYEQMKQYLIRNLQSHEDQHLIETMPFQTIIVGMKYDLYEKYDTESRKWLARSLRYIAHINNASLYFCSIKNMQTGAQLRAYIQEKIVQFEEKRQGKNKMNSHLASQIDHTKPIFVNSGSDSIRLMNLPSAGSMTATQILKKQLKSLFSSEEPRKRQPIDLSKYNENKIDKIINDKKKELERIAKMLQNSENRNSRI